MANFKFSCPHCQQHIEADTGYVGMQINCPACKVGMVVPGYVAAAAPVAVSAAPTTPPVPTTPTSLHLQASSSASASCPSCRAALPHGATLCTSCGYNLSTGRRIVAGSPAVQGKSKTQQQAAPWYKTPIPYVVGVILIMVTLYVLGKDNPSLMLAGMGVGLLYILTVKIIVLVAAFREGVGTGFLTLCIPFYPLYFVFRVHDNDTLKLLWGVAVIITFALKLFRPELK